MLKTILYCDQRCLYIIIDHQKYIFWTHSTGMYIKKYGIADGISENEFKSICFENKIKFDYLMNEANRIFKMIHHSKFNVQSFEFMRNTIFSINIEYFQIGKLPEFKFNK